MRALLACLSGLMLIAVLLASVKIETVTPPTSSLYSAIESAGLVDQHGGPIRLDAISGRTLLVQFIFTQCSATCPVQTRELVELQAKLPAALRRRYRFLSISLDPLSDTPGQLLEYAKRFGIDESGWTLATGQPEGIEHLAQALGLYGAAVAPYNVEEHGTSLWLVDGAGQVLQRYVGNRLDLNRLNREIVQVDQLSQTSHAALQ